MDELERRLRDSLQARAGDVESTPELWRAVQDRRARKRWLFWTPVAVASAAALVLAVVLGGGVVDRIRDRQPTDVVVGTPSEAAVPTAEPSEATPEPTPSDPGGGVDPTPEPSSGPTPVQATEVPEVFVGTDRTTVWIETPDGRGDLHTFPGEGESSVVSLAVRPGYEPDDLVVVLLMQAEGMYDLRWLHYTGDRPAEVRYFADAGPQYDISDDARRVDAEIVPAPVWSPDGRHLAWLEQTPDGGTRLRTIGWEDGPGTGRSADDNAMLGEGDVGADIGPGFRLQDWTWTADSTGVEQAGALTATDPISGTVVTWPIARQGDGALALEGGPSASTSLGHVVDLADAHLHDGPEAGPDYTLRVVGASEGTIDLQLRWDADGGQGGELPLPAELGRTNDPSGIWMTAYGDGVVVGLGGQAWLVTRAGEVTPFTGSAWYVDPAH